ncbi:MAG: hypothetical protein F6J95_023820 [Leptolyngbya sp. SIO1E4]|nr:hypothetical protein [Leptolyngbya sp. SIO1E4]
MKTVEVEGVTVDRLSQLEGEIQDGLEMVYRGSAKMQRALAEIRGHQLWTEVVDRFEQPVYTSFKHYVEVRWHLDRQTANKHALAGVVANEMLSAGVSEERLPNKTSQLLELKPVKPEQRLEVLETAEEMGGGKATAATIRAVVGESYRVTEEGNPHHGKTIRVEELKPGGIAIGPGGFPFLPGELEPANPVEKAVKVAKPTLRDKASAYRALLCRVLQYEIPAELRADIEAALAD